MKSWILFVVLCFSLPLGAQLPQVVAGRIERVFMTPKDTVLAPRNVDIWLPADYHPKRLYSVLIMHDGQMLYDAAITWNHQEWQVDETLNNLKQREDLSNCIVVGIWNNPSARRSEYWPQKALDLLPEAVRDSVCREFPKGKATSDAYLKFVVKEVLPMVRKNFRVFKDASHTYIAGSSMGGLISMYALCEYPKVFSRAACLSTHWIGFSRDPKQMDAVADSFIAYLQKRLPKKSSHYIYFDYGDQTLDQFYPPYQAKVDALMKEKGWDATHWQTRFFPGDNHSEESWSKRLATPMQFLLGN